MQGIWKTDEDDNAIFIDTDNEQLPEDHVYSTWDMLPDLALERIFAHLNMREKYWASLTCRNWYRAFHLPETWAIFHLDDYTLTRRKFNYYSGWQHTLDHWRTMQCLSSIGCHIRALYFQSMMNFYNLYEFMNMMSYYMERGGKDSYTADGVGRVLRCLNFVFPCHMRQKIQAEKCRIYGTGGQMLGSLKRLIGNMKHMTELHLIELQLEYTDTRHLLDEVCYNCCGHMKTLVLVNLTKELYPIIHPGVFINLQVLKISPQNLGEDLVELLGYTRLQHLHLVTTVFSPSMHGVPPIHHKTWQACAKNNPVLRVHIESVEDVLWQDSAPVASLIFTSKNAQVKPDIIVTLVERYSLTLASFAHLGMPRFHRSKSFHDRADGPLLLLARSCPELQSLVVRERISTATILLIATTAKKLQRFIVRRNAVIIKTDWPKSDEWSTEFFLWLKSNSRSYASVEREVSVMLGYRWHMVNDDEFKKLQNLPHS